MYLHRLGVDSRRLDVSKQWVGRKREKLGLARPSFFFTSVFVQFVNFKKVVTMNPKQERLIWQDPWLFVACGFGIGTLPVMPGTYATLFAVLLSLLIHPLGLVGYLSMIVLFNVVGVWLCGRANRIFGTDDHPAAVWDEIAAFPITMLGIPFTWYNLLIAFLLFRLFDIWKPGPIGWVDRNVHGGIGVLLDDILAALLTLGCLFFVQVLSGF